MAELLTLVFLNRTFVVAVGTAPVHQLAAVDQLLPLVGFQMSHAKVSKG